MSASPLPRGTEDAGLTPPVAAELEQIFLAATGVPSARAAQASPRGQVRRLPAGAGRRLRLSPSALGAAAAMAIAAVSAFAVAYTAPGSAPAPAAKVPVVGASPAIATAPPNEAPAPAMAALGVTQDPSRLATTQSAPRPHVVQAASWRRPHAVHRLAKGGAAPHSLMQADRQLRRAYLRAVSAGVPRPILADYRSRWNDLRREASWRPQRVALGYSAMAGDLNRMSEPPRHGGRRQGRWARAW